MNSLFCIRPTTLTRHAASWHLSQLRVNLYHTRKIFLLKLKLQQSLVSESPNAEMPTSGDLKSGDFPFITPWYRTTWPPPPRKRRWDLLHIKSTSLPPNRLRACNVTLTLQREKRKKISEVFGRLPTLTQSWTEVFEDFLMLAQTIRKVSKVHQSILKTNWFLIYWLMEMQSDRLLHDHGN